MTRMGIGGAALAALLALEGCAHHVAAKPFDEARPLSPEDAREILARVQAARGLEAKRPPNVAFVPRTDIKRNLARAASSAPDAGEQLVSRAFILSGARDAKNGTRAELGAAVARAYFSRLEDRVYIPSEPVASYARIRARATLAHELQHALQHQHFPKPEARGADAWLAYDALVEGDATATATVFQAGEIGVAPERLIRHLRYALESPPEPGVRGPRDVVEAWKAAPEAYRRLVAFPYREGLAFVLDLYRTGGFDLVNRAFSSPPASSEQILHPAKYLAGEQPREFASLDVPSGFKGLARTTLGELKILLMLSPCVGEASARAAAEGWDGDHAFILGNETELVNAWVSAWDTEADAAEVEDRLSRLSSCLSEEKVGKRTLGRLYAVRRSGTTVAFVRGGDATIRATLVDRLLALESKQAPPVPLTNAAIPPVRSLPLPVGGVIVHGAYRNDFLGIWANIPRAFTATLLGDDRLKALALESRYANGGLDIDFRISSPTRIEEQIAEREDQLLGATGGALARTGRRTVRTRLGDGVEQSWRNEKDHQRYRFVTIPICGGAGTVVLHFTFTVGQEEPVDAFTDYVRPIDEKARPPVCDYLDPKD